MSEDLKEIPNGIATSRVLLAPGMVAGILVLLAVILIFASSAALFADYLTGHTSGIVRKAVKLFYVDLELNVPTFFSTVLLLCTSAILGTICFLDTRWSRSRAVYWAVLSVGFLFMAFDEAVAVHERLIEPMRSVLGEENLGVVYYAWVVPASVLVLLLGSFFIRFLLNLPAKTRRHFLLAAILYVGGAIGLEFAEGSHAEIHGMDNVVYIALATVEEFLEMLGIIVFIRALLRHLAETFPTVLVQFDRGLDESRSKS
jgi:hypothetical protein